MLAAGIKGPCIARGRDASSPTIIISPSTMSRPPHAVTSSHESISATKYGTVPSDEERKGADAPSPLAITPDIAPAREAPSELAPSPMDDSPDEDLPLHRRRRGDRAPDKPAAAATRPSRTAIHFLYRNPVVPGLVSSPTSFSAVIVGSCAELGNWDPQKSNIWMKPLKGHPEFWYASVVIENGDGLADGRPHFYDWRKNFEQEAAGRIEPGKLAAYRRSEKQLARLRRKGHDLDESGGVAPSLVCTKCQRILETTDDGLMPADVSDSETSDVSVRTSPLPLGPHNALPPLVDLLRPEDLHTLKHTSHIEYKYVLRVSNPDASPGKIVSSPLRWEDGANRVIEWSTCPCHYGANDAANGLIGADSNDGDSWLPPGIEHYQGFLIDTATRRKKARKENSLAVGEWDEEMVRRLMVSDSEAGLSEAESEKSATSASASEGEGLSAVSATGDLPATVWVVEEGLGMYRDSRRVVVGRAPTVSR